MERIEVIRNAMWEYGTRSVENMNLCQKLEDGYGLLQPLRPLAMCDVPERLDANKIRSRVRVFTDNP